ncbi:hypothetical protein [Streptomyces fractus]|uniref:hypothetical protein n=1 Tax=Streptomyces fractus TaxID=641806 RepID=UPI003CEA6612
MAASPEELEERLTDLRAQLRDAARARDKTRTKQIRTELRACEVAWERALDAEVAPEEAAAPLPTPAAPRPARGAAVPVREQVHQSLTVLGAPASPKLIASVHEAFFAEPLVATKLASLRRDEERSFASQGHSRAYYICAALTHDRLAAARGLLAVSVWPLERRIIAPLSPRCDFLTHAVGIAEQMQRLLAADHSPPDAAWRLLRRFAVNIPGVYDDGDPDPARVIAAAHSEATVHRETDDLQRQESADRARARLADAQQLFGAASPHALRPVADGGS